jgi:ABC-type transporter Mla maintaining outer membrane lipid asymmetry ATPase subunit MlaF
MKNDAERSPVEVDALKKSFGAQHVLRGIDFQAAKAETLAVLGRSGTGKSALLRLMIGLQQPDSDCVKIHGEEIGSRHALSRTIQALRVPGSGEMATAVA